MSPLTSAKILNSSWKFEPPLREISVYAVDGDHYRARYFYTLKIGEICAYNIPLKKKEIRSSYYVFPENEKYAVIFPNMWPIVLKRTRWRYQIYNLIN